MTQHGVKTLLDMHRSLHYNQDSDPNVQISRCLVTRRRGSIGRLAPEDCHDSRPYVGPDSYFDNCEQTTELAASLAGGFDRPAELIFAG